MQAAGVTCSCSPHKAIITKTTRGGLSFSKGLGRENDLWHADFVPGFRNSFWKLNVKSAGWKWLRFDSREAAEGFEMRTVYAIHQDDSCRKNG